MLTLLLLAATAVPSDAALEAIKQKDGVTHAKEFTDAVNVNIRPELRKKLAPIVAAIRYAENGRAGLEYGVIHSRVKPTYRSQAGWCAATVQKNYDRWQKAGAKGEFIPFLGSRYCPLDDPKDKDKLNRYWVGNVTKFAKRFRGIKEKQE